MSSDRWLAHLRLAGLGGVSAILLAGSAAQAAPYWTCGAKISGPSFDGGYWQWFAEDGRAGQIILQTYVGPRRKMVTWHMTNRYSSAEEMKANYHFGGRPVETAFQGGPSFVQINFEFDHPAQGPLWAHYYGDGTFVGSELLVTARENRRHYAGRKAGLGGGLSNREILARLAPTRNWNVAVTDSSGRVIFRSDFLAPFSADMERLFRDAMIDYDSRVSDFRRNCQPNDPDDIQGL